MDESPSDAPAIEQDQPADVTDAPSAQETSAVEAPEYFSENFDPSTLPDALAPAYKQMQGAFTKKTTELAEQRKEAENAVAFIEALQSEDQREAALKQLAEAIGPEAVLEALGYSTETDDVDAEPLDPGEQALQAIEELKAQQASAQAEAQQAQQFQALEQHVEAEFSQYAKDNGLDSVPDEIRAAAVAIALAGDASKDGMPQIGEALKKLDGIWESRQKEWVQSKSAQKVAGQGQPGVEAFDIKNPDETVRRMAAIIDAGS